MNLVLRVATSVTAMIHPSEEARSEYLREHPGADPKNHKVDKNRPEEGDEKHDRYEDEKARLSDQDKRRVDRLKRDLAQGERSNKSPVMQVLRSMGKGDKLPPRLLPKALSELKSRAKNEKDPTAKETLQEEYEMFQRVTDKYQGK